MIKRLRVCRFVWEMYVARMDAAVRAASVHRQVRNALTAHVRSHARRVVWGSNAETTGAVVCAVYALEMGIARTTHVSAIRIVTPNNAAMTAAVDRVGNALVARYARNHLVSVKHNAFPNAQVNSVVRMAAEGRVVSVLPIRYAAIRYVCRRKHVFPTAMAKNAVITAVAGYAANVPIISFVIAGNAINAAPTVKIASAGMIAAAVYADNVMLHRRAMILPDSACRFA